MTVAGDDLRGRYRRQPQCITDELLDLGRNVRVRADGTAQLHHRNRGPCRAQPLPVTLDLQCPESDLGAEGGRLGVDAVRAADHHGVAMLACHADQRLKQFR